MERTLRELLIAAQTANIVQLGALLYTKDGEDTPLAGIQYSDSYMNDECIGLFNKACSNPIFRAYLCDDLLNDFDKLDKQCVSRIWNPITMSAEIIPYAVNLPENHLEYLKTMGAFDILSIYNKIYDKNLQGVIDVDTTYGKLTINVDDLCEDDKLRKWYAVYTENYNLKNGKTILDIGFNDYYYFWTALLKRFGESDDMYPIYHVSTFDTFSDHKLDCLKEYSDPWRGGWGDLLCGSDFDLGFIEDLQMLKRAVETKNKGADYFVTRIVTNYDNGDTQKFRVLVMEILSRERLAMLHSGYDSYLVKQSEYKAASDKDKWDEAFVKFLNEFPGEYKCVFDYPIPTAEDMLTYYAGKDKVETVKRLLPNAWQELDDASLKKATEEALEQLKG